MNATRAATIMVLNCMPIAEEAAAAFGSCAGFGDRSSAGLYSAAFENRDDVPRSFFRRLLACVAQAHAAQFLALFRIVFSIQQVLPGLFYQGYRLADVSNEFLHDFMAGDDVVKQAKRRTQK